MDTPAPSITNERGERLVAFHPATCGALPATDFALALPVRGAQVLLVRNTRRGVWELPGGWIDPGESARDCAARELREETGIGSARLSLRGWIAVEAGPPAARILTGAVFAATFDGAPAVEAGDEIHVAALWALDALPPDTSAIDGWLVARLARPE